MMGASPVNLVVEDALSESLGRRLLEHCSMEPGFVYGKEGQGFIKTRLRGFNLAAKGMRYFVLTDLDRFECAPDLWNDWLPGITRHPNLVFRVAVREAEAWILADCENLGTFFGLKRFGSVKNADKLDDPKRNLLELALKSPRKSLRESITFRTVHGALRQGPDYNAKLAQFVSGMWSISAAASRSDSLRRAVEAVRGLSTAGPR